MISETVVRSIEEVEDAKMRCLRELRRKVWNAAFSEFQGVDDAVVSVVRCKYGYQVRAEL